MGSPALPNIHYLGILPDSRKSAALDLLFEPSPEIHSYLIPVAASRRYSSYNEFIDRCRETLASMAAKSTADSPNQHLLRILGSHPRLGAKKVESAQSAAEQAKLGGDSEALARLNREYEDKFPGLRYVVFVNGRGRPEIMEDMKARIDRGDFEKEVDAALHVLLPPFNLTR
ncbi:Oxo-4-hydroxy-4-carboxy-5-ureidoimidazoline decarboxylase [Cordyceps fumosorosea ARSEF 2679]|uniref:Oxo-4-hydroxy-4-carboxy-5-ureidoimidazoline decarboxylase n=1 Tax=Cordyceps fumosorosea (strain ARSEF 2679) TaxID=1081104 RepID=A0A167LJ86_CORFA|nr:Oxo-4-hydroxy-4-carboxy-5-ureidoimidazoline decarboxylase [Cordyceps fumosorosea ARSEF 2679]OAA53147.1 Oxo-4-hydroxy-4-carboxy-5-ureidoimidazoline decarboxylase [Cordyceps fumosorosea ARSEF 2679]